MHSNIIGILFLCFFVIHHVIANFLVIRLPNARWERLARLLYSPCFSTSSRFFFSLPFQHALKYYLDKVSAPVRRQCSATHSCSADAPYVYGNETVPTAPTATGTSKTHPTGHLSANQTHSQCCFVIQDTVTADYWARMTSHSSCVLGLNINRLLHLNLLWTAKSHLRYFLHHRIRRYHDYQLRDYYDY